MAIKVLDSNLVNQIAAGEVLERPFAAVKELIENALDAGATQIEIIIENGGKSYLCVTDNGCGIDKNELSTAMLRHATSKLPDNDLQAINSFGFRGEALPSIGSVAKMTLYSRHQDADSAYKITIEGGNIGNVTPAALTKGTKVEVRDIFYATPARLKFLKSDITEAGKIEDVIKHIAMAAPYVSFAFYDGNKEKLRFNACSSSDVDNNTAFKARFSAVLGQHFEENFCAVQEGKGNISLKGFASLPTYTRGNSLQQFLFVNGRPIKDRLVLGAVKAAYAGLIPADRYPVVALFLEVPSAFVDVNVHPAKTEVRFQDYSAVRGLVITALKNAVAGLGYKVAGSLTEDTVKSFSRPYLTQSHQNLSDNRFNYQYAFGKKSAFSPARPQPVFPLGEQGFSAKEYSDLSNEQTVSDDNDLPPLGLARVQLYDTYIISQTKDGIILVDQHAACERLAYEKISKMQGIKESQLLLTPEIIDLSEKESEALLIFKDELEQMGLPLESFGNGSVLVRGVPAVLKNANVQQLVRDLVDTITDFSGTLSLQDKIKEICAKMACHGSVRAGRKLDIQEMNALLRQMEQMPNSGECIHGRPTYIELKIKDIERLFGRR